VADTIVPTRIEAMGPVVEALAREHVSAVAFSGKFWMGDLLTPARPTPSHARMAAQPARLLDGNITAPSRAHSPCSASSCSISVPFLGDWVGAARTWSAREPTEG
jgi:hypothetical protein